MDLPSPTPDATTSRRRARWRHAVTVAVVGALLGLTAGAAFVVDRTEGNERREAQRNAADRAASVLEQATASPLRTLEMIAAAMGRDPASSGATFSALAGWAMPQQRLVAGVAFARRQPTVDGTGAGTRAGLYVEAARVVRDGQGGRVVAPRIDVVANDPRARAVRTAERTRSSVATGMLSGQQAAIALFTPVSDGRGRILGALQSDYDAHSLMRVLTDALPAEIPFSVRIGGMAAPGARTTIKDAAIRRGELAGQPVEVLVGRAPRTPWPVVAALSFGTLIAVGVGFLTSRLRRRETLVTELMHRNEDERSAAEGRFTTAFAQAPVGMAVTSLAGTILQANTALAAIVGTNPAKLVNTALDQLLIPADRSWVAESAAMLSEGLQRVVHVDRRCLHAAGHVVWAAASLTLTRDADNQPQHLIAQFEDISARRRYEAHLRHLTDHDPLTGLYNRRAFERELDRHLDRIRVEGPRGAVIVVDVDHFKQINDVEGHHAGDELVKSIARTLRQRVGLGDVLARLGGDEFAVLLTGGCRADARAMANVVLDALREQQVVTARGREREITGSAGLVVLADDPQATGERVLADADVAMYDAKERGRDRLVEAAMVPDQPTSVRTRLTWTDRIRDAFEDDRFVLYAQPIVDLASGYASQYELLLRMRTESGEVVAPGAFLPIAERGGLISRIDRWVVTTAIELLAMSGADGPTFEVNLSGSSIGDEILLEQIERRLRECAIDPGRLVFEVTETVAVADVQRAQAFAARLKELGCRFALDDFGSGFGSFYYLKHLPFDFLKIDGEFVRDCASDATDRLIIGAAVEIARGMGKRTIAEVIEDETTLQVVKALGVDDGQGYHLGRPQPVEILLASFGRKAG